MSRRKRFVYERVKAKGTLAINQLTNLGSYEMLPAHFKVVNLRLAKNLADLRKWKRVGDNSGATFYRLPNKAVVVVKPEVWCPFPAMKIGKRETNRQPRRMLEVLNELVRRKVNIETPIGELVDHKGRTFYITKMEKGIQLADFLVKDYYSKKLPAIAKSMGEFLADLHNKGVLHGHPHSRNWLVLGDKAKLIDAKGISFREEYPWTSITGRTYVFENLVQGEAEAAAGWLPQEVREEFTKAYKHKINI